MLNEDNLHKALTVTVTVHELLSFGELIFDICGVVRRVPQVHGTHDEEMTTGLAAVIVCGLFVAKTAGLWLGMTAGSVQFRPQPQFEVSVQTLSR